MQYTDRADIIATARRLKVCVLVPTYNNGGTLRGILQRLMEYSEDIIVVNDGCSDNSADILNDFADRITVVTHVVNRGKGEALKSGFRKAMAMGYEYAVTIDSDGQHYPEDLPKFYAHIAANPGALIVGERNLTNVDINAKSSFANKFSNFWFTVQTGYNLKDTQTGYRAYPLDRLYGLDIMTARYEAELQLLVLAAWHGVRILSMPIQVYYPPQSERVSHFRPGLDFTRISILNTVLCCGALVYGLPVRCWDAVSNRKILNREFRFFTHTRGQRQDTSYTFGRIGRSLYALSAFATFAIGLTPLSELSLRLGRNAEHKRLQLHRRLMRASKFVIHRLPGAKSVVENTTGEDFSRPAVIVCNHQSHLDLPLLMSLHPKLVFLTNDRVWHNPWYGRIIRHAEYMPVSLGVDEMTSRLRSLVERGYSIVIFPEGTRSEDCRIRRFHQGGFLLAQQLGLDILPMVIHGAGHYWPKHERYVRKGTLSLRILPRVSQSQLEDMPLRKQASMLRALITDSYRNMAAKRESFAYHTPVVAYKYAYRGWDIVDRCKRTLRASESLPEWLRCADTSRNTVILNSGIGTFALLYALTNPSAEVYALESDIRLHNVAATTPGLPPNLHFIHSVWQSGREAYVRDAERVIHLNSTTPEPATPDARHIFLTLKS